MFKICKILAKMPENGQEDFIGEIDSDRHNQLHFLLTFLSRLVLNFPSVQTTASREGLAWPLEKSP